MAISERLSGNEAVSFAIKQINPDVVAAFPITPSTEIPQFISQYIANGEMTTVYVPVESEHSSMSACVGAQAAGARSMTATSSCGLAYMFEMLYIAASNRLPITMACVNRALSGPININNDHSDSMGARDAGWIQIYAENAQEAYDNFIQCVRIGEHKDVHLPVMACQDGFITSHAVERMELIETDKVKAFVGEYNPEKYLLNPDEILAVGTYDTPQYYMEHKKAQTEAMKNARQVIKDIAKEFETISGRKYDMIEEYRMEDAEYAMVIIGSSAGTAKEAIDELRTAGVKAGLIKVRVFRPFPLEEIAAAL
ncbi:MAG TPA: pyruvate ferredoxin oxidoreductase, partial [Peptococcaceae bacterium]|nr:pyruvate ferredoxin oxidoreductase [Peptococcaceae bacterium]